MEALSKPSTTENGKSLSNALETSIITAVSNASISIYEIRSNRHQFIILTVLAVSAIVLPFSDAVYLPALEKLEHDLHTNTMLVDYTLSTYLICAGICTLLWGPLSDRFGRKIILVLSLFIYIGFTIACTLARSIIALLIFRSLQGAAISASLVVGQSAIVDIYQQERLGFAMGLYFVPFLIGPIVGPFVGGFLSEKFGWRSTFICLGIMAVVSTLLIVVFVPETHHYFVLQHLSHSRNKNQKRKHKTNTFIVREADTILKPRFIPPWYSFSNLLDTTIVPHILVCNMNFTALFVLLTLISNRESQEPYSLSPLHIGFTYIPLGVSSLIGSIGGGWITDWSAKHFSQAMEGRLIFNLLGCLACPIGLLLCGWTFHFRMHLALPVVGSAIFSFGETFLYTSVCAFLNLKKPAMSGSILALVNSISFICSGAGIIGAAPLLQLIGFGSLFSLLAGLCFLFLCISAISTIYQLRCASLHLASCNALQEIATSKISTIHSNDLMLIQWF